MGLPIRAPMQPVLTWAASIGAGVVEVSSSGKQRGSTMRRNPSCRPFSSYDDLMTGRVLMLLIDCEWSNATTRAVRTIAPVAASARAPSYSYDLERHPKLLFPGA